MTTVRRFFASRARRVSHPYFYNPAQPAMSLIVTMFAYLGAAVLLVFVMGALQVGAASAAREVFDSLYPGLIAMFIGGATWVGERRHYLLHSGATREMMVGPIDELDEK